jgi:effector-binding domain-containing protein
MNKFFLSGLLISAITAGAVAQSVSTPIPKITILDVTPFAYVSIPHKGPISDMGQVVGLLIQAMQNQRLFPPTGPMMGVYYSAPSGAAGDMIWELGFPVTSQASPLKPLEKKRWIYTTVASTLHVGPYNETAKLIPVVMSWLTANGYVPAGPVAERYLDMDPSRVKPADLKTELWVPCRKIK